MTSFIVEPLPREHIHAVYPLIREALPGLALAGWVKFARGVTGVRRNLTAGIVVARRDGQTFPSGLFCYRVERDLTRDKILVAEHFVAVDLLYPGDVLDALVGELDRLGARLGCGAVRSIVRRRDLQGTLTLSGHEDAGALFSKTLIDDGLVTLSRDSISGGGCA